MKVIVSKCKLHFVNPSRDQAVLLQELPIEYLVKEVANGYTVKAPKDKLFDLLYNLSCKYDIELV